MFSRIPKPTLVLLAFASVYLFWGSTYMAIHVAGEHLPAPVVAGVRSLISTTLILAICLARGKSLRVPRGEKMVPSGFASLIVSTMPIMIALMEMGLSRMGQGGEPLNARGWAGTLLGTLGIAVLVSPSLRAGLGHGPAMAGYSRPVQGVCVLLIAALSFGVGSVLSRRFHFQADTFVATGWQLGSAGIFNISLAAATGCLHRAVWTWTGFGAIVYLSVFGSLFGLVAFTYLLQNVAVTKVSTYAFVNPVIAVLLGVLVLHERLVKTELAGMVVIVCGVAMVVYSRVGGAKKQTQPGQTGELSA
jgi:drug/metabolite transporter (DMT)-like permease